MIKHKHIDRICALATALMLLLTLLLFAYGPSLLTAAASQPPYVQKVFDASRVHTLDIVADAGDWQTMLDTAQAEEYISCTAVIDGESYKNVGIRPKGNSSLTTVANSDSDRYSFKLEFDHYDPNQTYYGLDKLCLNNCIQDNTYMKDYLCYRMMGESGADAPLTSYVFITVNGQDWGLYIAAEAIEDAFALRSYGANHGQLYKPDSMDMGGGGRGAEAGGRAQEQRENFNNNNNNNNNNNRDHFADSDFTPPDGFSPDAANGNDAAPRDSAAAEKGGLPGGNGFGNFGRGGMGGSSDVLLCYTTDDPEDYPNIFDNAVFSTVSQADQDRLIAALKKLSQGDVAGSVNMEEVANYFAVHNFVLNDDSYTGSIIHNYYLYEDEGLLSMVAWDYNLAFGGMSRATATAAVNSPIDSPVSDGDISQRPMVAWLFDSDEHTQLYHQALDRLLAGWFESGYFEELLDQTVALISPYVERDPTAFCSYEDFTAGAAALREFCLLRAQSVRAQLSGEIASTSEGQAADSSGFIDASHLQLSDMGNQDSGLGGGRMAGFGKAQATAGTGLSAQNGGLASASPLQFRYMDYPNDSSSDMAAFGPLRGSTADTDQAAGLSAQDGGGLASASPLQFRYMDYPNDSSSDMAAFGPLRGSAADTDQAASLSAQDSGSLTSASLLLLADSERESPLNPGQEFGGQPPQEEPDGGQLPEGFQRGRQNGGQQGFSEKNGETGDAPLSDGQPAQSEEGQPPQPGGDSASAATAAPEATAAPDREEENQNQQDESQQPGDDQAGNAQPFQLPEGGRQDFQPPESFDGQALPENGWARWAYLGGAVLLLAAGLVFAKLYK